MSEPVPADFTVDLAALEHRQALLHAALAAFQAGIPQPQPLGAYGLALYHRLAVVNDEHSIEAVLVHSAGGEIASGFLPIDGNTVSALQRVTADLLISAPIRSLPVEFCTPQQTQSPIPWPVPGGTVITYNPADFQDLPLQQDPPAAAVGPEPESPAAAAKPEPEPEAQPDEPPTAEEVAAIKEDLDYIFNRRPSAVKKVTAAFRAAYGVGSGTPVAKAITTREHLTWLLAQIDPILVDIADFEQQVKAGVAESIAQGAA